jgi:DDE superfamily endonuclease
VTGLLAIVQVSHSIEYSSGTAGVGVHVPVKKPARGELDIDTKTRNALLRSLRYQGERGFALMSQRWRAIQHVSLSPATIGDVVKSALVLTQFEHKMIS